MLKYWPTATGKLAEKKMNSFPKIIFSRTLKSAEWNSRVAGVSVLDEISRLKQQEGKDMVLFAGADLLSTLIQHELIDEYRLIVAPVVLGSGHPLFKNLKHKLNLSLSQTMKFSCGNVILFYEPSR